MADSSPSLRIVFWFLFLLTVDQTTATVCTKINDCECRKSNGKIMSLKAVDSGTTNPRFEGIKGTNKGNPAPSTFYSWNPCTKFSDGKCENDLLCQQNGKNTYPIGNEASTFTENADGSITLAYKPIKYSDGYTREGIITLVCDTSQDPGKPGTFNEEPGTGADISQYKATFRSKCVCDDGCPDNPGGNTGGLSTGSVLLIVFFLLLLIYIVAGLLFNKYRKGVDSFPEMIPNHSFWADFPLLVKDGCVFACQGVSACCKSLYSKLNRGSYAAI